MVDIAKVDFDNGSLQEALYEVYVGITVGSSHGWYFFKKNAMGFAALVLGTFGLKTGGKKNNAIKEAKELKVVGVGYGRTGTVSRLAFLTTLVMLGRCQHWSDEHARFLHLLSNDVFNYHVKLKLWEDLIGSRC